ncbi:MAG TPA: hypothetical protein VGW74_09425 [Propionibacteriaceae bacterium]|nr:hypothetical protein [Propionibacteriaceae bacterium]
MSAFTVLSLAGRDRVLRPFDTQDAAWEHAECLVDSGAPGAVVEEDRSGLVMVTFPDGSTFGPVVATVDTTWAPAPEVVRPTTRERGHLRLVAGGAA